MEVGGFGLVPFKVGTRVYINTPDGRRLGFTFDPQPGEEASILGGYLLPYFRPDPGVMEELLVEQIPLLPGPNGTLLLFPFGFAYNPREYTLVTKDQLRYRYDQFQELLDITDRNGVKVTYSTSGMSSSTGESIAFVRDGQGRITAIEYDPQDPDQPGAVARIQYEYNAAGDLVRVTNADGESSEMTYVVGRPHFLEQVFSTCGCFPLIRSECDDDGWLIAD